jgi:hypothetical protein
LEVTVIFDANKFIVSIVVTDCKWGFLIDSFLGSHLAGNFKDFFNGVEGLDAFDGRLVVTSEGELNV